MLEKVTSMAVGRIKPIDKSVAAELALRFSLGAATAAFRFFGGFSPFGAAFAASAPVGKSGVSAMLGAALGYLLSLGATESVKYIAVIVMIRATFMILRNLTFSESPWYPLAVTGISFALVGFVYVFDDGFGAAKTAIYLTECVVGAGSVLFYRIALSPWSDDSDGSYGRVSHLSSLCYLLCTALAGISSPAIFGVLSVGRTLAIMAVMLAVFKSGIGMGCAVAAALGIGMDLAAGSVGVYTLAYVMAALISGIFRKSGRLVFLLSFVAANALGVVWSFSLTGSITPLYDAFAASVIFMLVPDYVLSKLGAVFPVKASGYGFSRAREYTSRRMKKCGEAFGILAGTAAAVTPEEKATEPAAIFDRATETVCRGCRSETRCWQVEYGDTYDILNHLTPKVTGQGNVAVSDFPDRLTERCDRIHWLVGEINSEARSARLRKRFHRDMNDSRESSAGRLGDVSRMFTELSRELSGGLKVEPSMERKLQKALGAMSIDASVAVFRLGGGRLRIEIKSESLSRLRRAENWLECLSNAAECRLRESVSADPTRLILLSAEPLKVSMGVAVQAKRGTRYSGDSFSGFETDEGEFCLIISDGMGTGEEAAKISSAVVSGLKRFIEAGVPVELGFSFLEHAMFLRNGADTETSTVDFLEVDAFSGEARITKRGAPASYIRRGGTVKKIGADPFPTGILRPKRSGSSSAFKLIPGDEVIMLTDGVTQGEKDAWLAEALGADVGGDPQRLADSILAAAKQRSDYDDDMTVVVISVENR